MMNLTQNQKSKLEMLEASLGADCWSRRLSSWRRRQEFQLIIDFLEEEGYRVISGHEEFFDCIISSVEIDGEKHYADHTLPTELARLLDNRFPHSKAETNNSYCGHCG